VIGFLSGELGDPPGGWPEPFRSKALAGRSVRAREEKLSEEDRAALADRPRATLNRLLFPGPSREMEESRSRYGDLAVLPTLEYLYGLRPGGEHEVVLEEGVRLFAGLEAISEPDERGLRTVMCRLNGQLRPVQVRDRAVASSVPATEKADPSTPGQVAAPFGGVVTLAVAEGDVVQVGQTVATIEAMKMEASITTPVGGVVQRLALSTVAQVEGGDLILVVAADG
jgi:pyruvate carboxylase